MDESPFSNPALHAALNRQAEILTNFQKRAGPEVEAYQARLAKITSNLSKALLRLQEELPRMEKSYKELVTELSSLSWYLPLDASLGINRELIPLLNNKEFDRVDEILAGTFHDSIKDIDSGLKEKYPDRFELLERAFHAHSEEDYFVSVPLFLAQADGISNPIAGAHFFRSGISIREIEPKISDADFSSFTGIFLRMATTKGTIRDHTSNVEEHILNRHRVLHGDDLHYGTRVNSFKAISVLNYIYTLDSLIGPIDPT